MINNLDKIESPELVSDIKSLYNEILNKVVNSTDTPNKLHLYLNAIISHRVLGIDKPICICEGYIYSPNFGSPIKSDLINYECYLVVNSEVMYLYINHIKKYQTQ